jgi:hypothetical protein
MKKRYLFIALLALGACKGNTNNAVGNSAGKLPASMVSNPHTADGIDNVAAAMKPTMDFKDTLHDFGQIPIMAKPRCSLPQPQALAAAQYRNFQKTRWLREKAVL